MKTFKQFLVESSYTPLYHGTLFRNVHKILTDGHIAPSESGHVSLTRSKKYVEGAYGEGEAYFKFDKDRVKHNSKITPTDWNMGGSVHDKHHDDYMRDESFRRSESEEAVKGKVSLKHATELIIHKKHWDALHKGETPSEKNVRMMSKKQPENRWLYQGLQYKDRMKESRNFKKLLRQHPHIKVTIKDY